MFLSIALPFFASFRLSLSYIVRLVASYALYFHFDTKQTISKLNSQAS